MLPHTAAEALMGILGFAGLVFLWFGPLRWLATDWARNTMFAARERLWDEAGAGRISFDDPSYRYIRDSINGSIRFAHSLSLVRVLYHMRVVQRSEAEAASNELRASITRISDPRVRRTASIAIHDVRNAGLWLMFFKSPILGIALVLYLVRPAITIQWQKRGELNEVLEKKLRPYADVIQAEAAAS
jgi:hypothetical protein